MGDRCLVGVREAKFVSISASVSVRVRVSQKGRTRKRAKRELTDRREREGTGGQQSTEYKAKCISTKRTRWLSTRDVFRPAYRASHMHAYQKGAIKLNSVSNFDLTVFDVFVFDVTNNRKRYYISSKLRFPNVLSNFVPKNEDSFKVVSLWEGKIFFATLYVSLKTRTYTRMPSKSSQLLYVPLIEK